MGRRSPPRRRRGIANWIAALPPDTQPEAAKDLFRSVRYRNPDEAFALLRSWQDDPALARPVAEFLLSDQLNDGQFSAMNAFLRAEQAAGSPLYEIGRRWVQDRTLSDEIRSEILEGIP